MHCSWIFVKISSSAANGPSMLPKNPLVIIFYPPYHGVYLEKVKSNPFTKIVTNSEVAVYVFSNFVCILNFKPDKVLVIVVLVESIVKLFKLCVVSAAVIYKLPVSAVIVVILVSIN
jgi:hypothetical protein